MRGRMAMFLALGVMLISGARPVQVDAAEGPVLTSLGLPTLAIRVTDDRIEAPPQIAAGRTLISIENAGANETQLLMGQLPPGKTGADLLALQDADVLPDWLFQILYVGIPGYLPPGGQGETVVDLAPGVYTLLGTETTAEVTVTPSLGSPAAPVTLPTDVTLRLFEMGFQLPSTLAAGRHVFAVVNAGRVPHELQIERAPAPITTEGAQEIFASDDDAATPEGGGPAMRDLTPVAGVSWMAAGATAWLEVALEPGTYVLSCWVYDPATQLRHAAEGMVAELTVT